MSDFTVIKDDWTPTAENVNALPAPLRKYIHTLESEMNERQQDQAVANGIVADNKKSNGLERTK